MLLQLTPHWGIALLVVCWAAAIKDLRTYTIPHIYPGIVLALLPIALFFVELSWPFLGFQALSGIIAFVVGFLLFAIGVMGGGDVKLFAALALWVPLRHLIVLVMAMTLLGLVYTIGVLIYRSVWPRSEEASKADSFFKRLGENLRSRLPYGPAIAMGFTAYLYLIYK